MDATAAGAALYATLGFVTADETGIFGRDGDRSESADESAIESDALRSAITFDAAILGCDRSPTLRELASERGARLVVDPAGYLLTRRGAPSPMRRAAIFGQASLALG